MFVKLNNRHDVQQLEAGHVALRDIIPSNESTISKKPDKSRLSSICRMTLFILMLGLIAVGIVLLALVFIYSHYALINFMTHSSSSNQTRILLNHQKNASGVVDGSDWKKITLLPSSNNRSVPSPTVDHTQVPSTHLSSGSTINERFTSTTIKTISSSTSASIQEDLSTVSATVEQFTSTDDNREISSSPATEPKTVFSTDVNLHSSTERMRRKRPAKKVNPVDDDDILDDLLLL